MTRPAASKSLLGPTALGLLAAALAAAIWLELHPQLRESGPMTPRPAASLPAVPARHSAAPSPNQVAQWSATILARPLFSPGRRPPAAAAAAPSAAAPTLPRVAGIMVTPAGRRAIFAEKGSKPLVLGEGGQVSGFTVQSIQAGQVTVRGPEGLRVLSPTFDPEARAPASTPNTPPGPPMLSIPGLPGFQLQPRPAGLGGIPGLAAPQLPGPAPRAAR